MPYTHGVFHDFFTQAEREVVTQLQADVLSGFGYSSIPDFTDICLDGTFSLDVLATFVAEMIELRSHKRICACGGHRHDNPDEG